MDLEPDDPDRAADMTVACPCARGSLNIEHPKPVHSRPIIIGWFKRGGSCFECPECQRPFDNKKAVEAPSPCTWNQDSVLRDKPVTRLDLHVRMVHTDLPEWPCPDCGIRSFKRKFDPQRTQ